MASDWRRWLTAHYSRLVPKLLLGNANFNPSSAWRSSHITSNTLKLHKLFCQAGAWQDKVIPKLELGNQIQNLLTAYCSLLTFLLKIFHNRRGQGRDGERGGLDPGRDAVFRQRRGGDGADGGHGGLGG